MKNRRAIAASVFFILLTAAVSSVFNMGVSIRQGVDGHYRKIGMPLYVKWIEFLGRHYEYARIAKEITAGRGQEEEKVLAILKWTGDNILPGVPEDLRVVDDHILNIIIRGYGTSDQLQDVFTTLCAYSGIPAFWGKVYDPTGRQWWPLSFVRMDGKWRVFDAYYGIYFRTGDGRIASVEDIIDNKSLVKGRGVEGIVCNGIPYREFYHNLKPVERPSVLRSEKQMPGKRILYEIKKIIVFSRDNKHTIRGDET